MNLEKWLQIVMEFKNAFLWFLLCVVIVGMLVAYVWVSSFEGKTESVTRRPHSSLVPALDAEIDYPLIETRPR